MKRYTLPFDPIAWSRAVPNHSLRRMYDKQKQEKLICGIHLRNQHGTDPIFQGPLHLSVTFFMAIPATKRTKNIGGKPHACKPDLDNLEKFLQDCANGILFRDDALISKKTSQKVYDTNPRIEFTLEEIK